MRAFILLLLFSSSAAFAFEGIVESSFGISAVNLGAFGTNLTPYSIGISYDADYNYDRQIVHLGSFDGAKAEGALKDRDGIAPVSPLAGYRVSQRLLVRGELGASLDWNFWNPQAVWTQVFALSIGIRPILGRQFIVEKTVKSKAAIPNFQAMEKQLPVAKDFLRWSVGDQISYEALGGVAFFAGLSRFPLGINLAALANGVWNVMVVKLADQKVYLKISKQKISEFSVELQGNILALKAEEFSKSDEGFAYEVDISTEAGRMALNDMMKGNLAGVQAEKVSEVQSVRALVSYKTDSQGLYKSFFVGIPFLAAQTSSSVEVSSRTSGQNLEKGENFSSETMLYKSEVERKLFFQNSVSQKAFSFELKRDSSKVVAQGAVASWYFSGEKMGASELVKSLNEIIRSTGLYYPIQLGFPDDLPEGFARVQLKVRFSQEHLNKLFDLPRHLSEEDFLAAAQIIFKRLFHVSQRGVATECVNDILCFVPAREAETWAALHTLWQLIEQGQNLQDEAIEPTALMTKIGKYLMMNATTFQTVLRLLGEGVQLDYRVEGEQFSRYKLEMKTLKTPELQMESVPQNSIWSVGEKAPLQFLPKRFVEETAESFR